MERNRISARGSRTLSVAEDKDELVAKRLIREFKQGDQNAFTELVRRYRSQVTALAYKMVNDYDEAADVAQNVFVKVSNNIWRYDDQKRFYTWLHRITVNASIDYIRKHRRHRHEQLDDFHDSLEGHQATPDLSYSRRQIDGFIKKAAELLNEKQRSAFMLRDVEGNRIDDVASIMEVPEATARWYLHRARSRIRKELLRKCPQLLAMLGIG